MIASATSSRSCRQRAACRASTARTTAARAQGRAEDPPRAPRDDEEYVERFRREARAVAQLSHPNIVTVIDRGEDDGRQFIVFEYVDGRDPEGARRRRGAAAGRRRGARARDRGRRGARVRARAGDRPPRREAAERAPERRRPPKVTDFGIARSLDVEHGVTQTGTVLGTSNYIAPEQARAERRRRRRRTSTRSASSSTSC